MYKPGVAPRIAVVGGGHLGRIHAKLIASNSDCQFVGVADPSEASRKIIEEELKLPTFDDYRSLEGSVDAVIIAAPTFLHFPIGSWFLGRGVHCLIEKPIAASTDESHRLVSLAHENQCVLQIGHVERFNPAWTAIASQLHRDSIRYIEAAREGTYTGRSTDIGIVMDLMIHDIDLILSVVESPVDHIHAYGWSVLGVHEDFAVAQLRFKNGTIAQLRSSRISESPKRSMQIYADEGMTSIDFASSTLECVQPHSDVASGLRLADSLSPLERSKVKDNLFSHWLNKRESKPQSVNAIAMEQGELIRAVTNGSPVTVDGHAGAAALGIASQIVSEIHKHGANRSIIPAADRFAA